MGPIHGQALVADLDNDGHLEVFAADMRGNIALFRADGTEVWERHVGSGVPQVRAAPVAGQRLTLLSCGGWVPHSLSHLAIETRVFARMVDVDNMR